MEELMGPGKSREPIPLFMDVDGGLCALPVYLGAVWPNLERVKLNTPDPYPSHAWVSPSAVTALNGLIDEGLVRPVWCTTWDDAANFLVPALGLHGGPWPVATVGTRHGDLVQHGIWIKTEAVSRFIGDQRFVIVDDLLGDPDNRPWTAQRRSMEIAFGGDNLLIGTKPERGITMQEIVQIRNYVEQR
ncbi:hypothetical protein QN357_13505 [Cryobacterium sp. RTC2.1]|uniref:hypothetical protein n=1 Tax=Cryobacterium sp. RTC2.1 TaxID=3048634 RepID=UPI002B22730B|nr:hypothetical protein [Cryobacterium sp. RTC2.1]MEB0003944.1 hypothetical protein [Cryobacterium sp. RTC2.1]